MGGPAVASATGIPDPGRSAITSGNFTPGTIAPGVSTVNPNAPGSPVFNGPFTPGTIAPGVSQRLGNAPPAAAGATTSAITRGTPAALQGPAPPGTTNSPTPANGQTVGGGGPDRGTTHAHCSHRGGHPRTADGRQAEYGAAHDWAAGDWAAGGRTAGRTDRRPDSRPDDGCKAGGAAPGGGTPR